MVRKRIFFPQNILKILPTNLKVVVYGNIQKKTALFKPLNETVYLESFIFL